MKSFFFYEKRLSTNVKACEEPINVYFNSYRLKLLKIKKKLMCRGLVDFVKNVTLVGKELIRKKTLQGFFIYASKNF